MVLVTTDLLESPLAGLRDVPLAALVEVDAAILDAAVACLFPAATPAKVPVAAFQSAILVPWRGVPASAADGVDESLLCQDPHRTLHGGHRQPRLCCHLRQ
jgi:FXSXX-COOH protein